MMIPQASDAAAKTECDTPAAMRGLCRVGLPEDTATRPPFKTLLWL